VTERLRTLARYNAWANHHLYAAAAALPDEQYRADRGAFFKSVHGTLNHLLATDRIWMRRFTGEGAAPDRLDAILFDDLPSLHAARRPRTPASSATSTGWTMPHWPGLSATPAHPRPSGTSMSSGRRSTISSTTRPTTAGKSTRF